MSFNVYLIDENSGHYVPVKPHEEGGTYQVGGCPKADLNITYNYSKFYYEYLNQKQGLRFINGKKAKDVTDKLESAIGALGTKKSDDYWEATRGNAGFALSILLEWAKQWPDAVFQVE